MVVHDSYTCNNKKIKETNDKKTKPKNRGNSHQNEYIMNTETFEMACTVHIFVQLGISRYQQIATGD